MKKYLLAIKCVLKHKLHLLLNQHVSNIKTGNYTKCLATDYLAVVDNFLLITKDGVMCEQDSDKVHLKNVTQMRVQTVIHAEKGNMQSMLHLFHAVVFSVVWKCMNSEMFLEMHEFT